ncbi:hypothetical protein D3C76_436490 [compost metagenome]
MRQRYPQAFQGFGFVAFELAGAQLFGQYDSVAVAQVPRCQGQLAQFSEAFGAHSDFFAQLALRRLQVVFIGLGAALGQAENGFFHTDRVFAHQQHMLWIGHRHQHHRAITGAAQAFVDPLLAVAELQVQGFDLKVAALRQQFSLEDGWAVAHGAVPCLG